MVEDDALTDAESCPHCAARLEPEAETCASCGKSLFEEPEDEEGGQPAYAELVLVHRGQPTEVLSLHAALQSRGFHSFVPDATTKLVDPFLTGGGNALLFELMAPAGEAEAVREEIEVLRHGSPDATEPAPQPPQEPADRLEELARKTWFSLIIMPPLVVYWGGQYLILSGQEGRKAKRHVTTLVAFWIGLLESLLLTGVFLWFLRTR